MFNAAKLSLGALFPSLARTVTANGTALNVRSFLGRVKVILDSAAGAGTAPTLDVKLQDSPDGTTGWADITGAAFAQVTDAGPSLQDLGLGIDRQDLFIRAVATITGSAGQSFTFSVNMIGNKESQ